jgi:regulator of cell morphogenesis and NO signaling
MRTISTFMRDDHARLEAMFMEFRGLKASNDDAAKAAFSLFKESWHRHIALVETVLFPVFEQRTGLVDHGPSVVMRQEHWRILADLAAIEERFNDTAVNGHTTEDLTQSIAAHHRKGKTILYPWIDAIISVEEAQELVRQMRSFAYEPLPDYCHHGTERR